MQYLPGMHPTTSKTFLDFVCSHELTIKISGADLPWSNSKGALGKKIVTNGGE